MPRPYIKRNEGYWNSGRKHQPTTPPVVVHAAPAAQVINPVPFPEIVYNSTELIANAAQQEARASAGLETTFRASQQNSGLADPYSFQNLRALPSTYAGYTGTREFVGVQEPIILSMKAWGGVPCVRNAIEVSVEFSSQPLWFKSDNQTVQTFFQEWWRAVRGNRLVEQSMREYYRSGNVFFMSFYGRFGPDYYKNYQQSFGAKENKIPIRYEILNPSNVFVPNGLCYPYTYARMMSTYELERLKTPITPQDKQVFNDLPENIKLQLKNGSTFPLGVWIPLEPDRLRYFFYKKQDYEPLAIPMIWPVLPDIEWKLGLKKMDMELARKIEHAILIVTTGEKGDQWNGGNGINQNNIARLQALFTNQAIMRTLVADYTTKGEWLIPDVKEILGPEKYEVVDRDIREGLQSILTGEDKFANAQIKAKIFIQRLEEGQNRFLNDFLIPEIVSICDRMGFRNIPEVGFQKINLQDETVIMRIITQLGQIGILTAEQVIKAIDTGLLPNATELKRGQQEYKKDREDGLYQPLIGGQKDAEGDSVAGRPTGTKTPQSTKKVSPIGVKSAKADAFSMKAYSNCLKASQELQSEVVKQLCKIGKASGLNKEQSAIATMLVKRIMAIKPVDQWIKSVAQIIKNPPEIPAEIAREMSDIAIDYEVDDFDAAILRHCRSDISEDLSAVVPQFRAQASVVAQPVQEPINHKVTIEIKQPEPKAKTVKLKKTSDGAFEISNS